MNPGYLAGKYRLLATLGHGGMADVYLAAAQGVTAFDRLLVIKELRPALAQDQDFLDMFLDEARLVARLSHPNVVQTYETLSEAGRHFIAMEYLDGQPLNRILAELAKQGGLPWAMGARVLSEALAALHYAHELRDDAGVSLEVVHRDVTPHNLFVTYEGQVKLVDFGIAKAIDSSTETRVGMLKGKVGYMAPEQSRGDPVDRRTDIYGMGVVLWEMLSRRRMWRGLPDVTILNRLAAGDVPKLEGLAEDAPEALRRCCERATAADPAARYQSAEQFRLDLDEYSKGLEAAPEPSAVGALLAETFAAERQRMQSVIQLQLMDSTRLPAVVGHTHSSRSGSLDPRVSSIPPNLLTPTPFVVTVSGEQPPEDVDTTMFPHARARRQRRRRWLVGGALVAAAVALLWLALPRQHGASRLELAGAIQRDTTLSADHVYVLKAAVEVQPGVTLTIEPGTRVVADPISGGSLVLRPGARLQSP